MKKTLIMIFIFGLLLQTGCARQIRYSENEIQSFPAETQEHIRKGEISLGMNHEQVRYAWGNPDSQKVLEPYEGKTREEWIYSKLGVIQTKILLFYDGKLLYIK
jgi:hypothetical protein